MIWSTSSTKDTLLIIDDTPDNIKVLFHFLTHEGFKVLIAKSGQEALQKIEQVQPDLILLDVMMPGMNGFEVCRLLKSDEKTKFIPIIFMTALTDTVDKVKGFSVGAADYVTKPIQYEEVLARVNAHLKLRKLQSKLEAQNQELQEEIDFRQEMQRSLQEANRILSERTVELQTRTQELEKRNMELDAFAHMVAHDLKNPLSGIIGLTEVLTLECFADPKAMKTLSMISVSGKKMFNIINALLMLAGVSRQAKVKIAGLDMANIIDQVIQQRLPQMIEEYQADIQLPESWPIAQGYAPWIEEVWANYISNGLKYGGQPPCLKLGATVQKDHMIRFWIHDNGEGLSSEGQTQLFTPFTRLHAKVEGHGLGLSIVQQIVEKLGGQVGMESLQGKGSLFYFTLPLKT